jgi:hypothetical protein
MLVQQVAHLTNLLEGQGQGKDEKNHR